MACRTVRPKRELVRVVRTPAGQLMIDETGRVAGRGAYLCRDAGCWTTALGRDVLGRALEAPLTPELRETLRVGAEMMTMTDEGGAGGTK